MERQQATPGGLDETISALRDGFERLTLERGLNQVEGWRLRLEASSVPELQPVADGLVRLENELRSDGVDAAAAGGIPVDLGGQLRGIASSEVGRDVSGGLEPLAGLLEREGRRLADAAQG